MLFEEVEGVIFIIFPNLAHELLEHFHPELESHRDESDPRASPLLALSQEIIKGAHQILSKSAFFLERGKVIKSLSKRVPSCILCINFLEGLMLDLG